MAGRYFKWFIAAMALTLVLAASCVAAQHSITIYVDEGHWAPNGHVFIGLSDGRHTFHYGFYAQKKALALAGLGGGKVSDDSALADGGKWDVKKTYTISEDDFNKAYEAVFKWRGENKPWTVNRHCGDFAEAVAKAAGIKLDLPKQKTGRTRPGLFGEYLRKNAGIVRKDAGLLVPDPNPALAPIGLGDIDLNGKWASDDYTGGREIVIIKHYGEVISAIKTKGNKYVPAGAVAWQGKYTSRAFPGRGQQADYDGFGKITRRYYIDIVIDVIDENTVSASGWAGDFPNKRYTRVRS